MPESLGSFSLRMNRIRILSLGAYRNGSDEKIDAAIAFREPIMAFINQPLNSASNFNSDIEAIKEIVLSFGRGGDNISNTPAELVHDAAQ